MLEAMTLPDLAGTVLAGKYRIEALLGRGGMGSVWRALHLGLHAPVAVKLLDLVGFAHNAESLNRFHREARAAAAIRSPHVVQILDHGVDEALDIPFIVMELMVGESLAQRLERAGRVAPEVAARVFTHVARALSRAHEAGIVHRDLKPDNVFLVWNEDEEVAKVLDFGIAKAQAHGMTPDSATRTGAVMGTGYYMSPEQISGKRDVDLRTDIWAYGVMACECLTGVRPFDADTIGGLTLRICIEPIPQPSSFAPVPDGFDAWFARAVDRNPGQRFQSAREAAEALRQVCTGVAQAGTSSGLRFLQEAAQATAPTGADLGPSTPTGGPLSVSAQHARSEIPKKPSGALYGILGAVAVFAVGGGLWLRHAKAELHADDASVTPSATAASAAQSAMKDPVVVAPVGVAPEVVASPIAPPAASASASPSVHVANAPPAARVPAGHAPPAPRVDKPGPAAALAAPVPLAAPAAPTPLRETPKAAPASTKGSPPVRDVIDDRH
jgi:eukaryotic-like serine/threonine-protein kinase